ncbi:MAG TPA: gamma-glutamyl-gamma-aminobutyrate hydrolase family protein [Candidatus Saccharimonadales bacterium]
MQPVIGITMCYDNNDLINKGVEYNYVRREYSEAVRAAGGQPLFLDPGIDPLVAAKLCDGVVISGGEDIDPTLYGQTQQGSADLEPRQRTNWERQLIDACDEWSRPILGICYGEQLLNVHYGGTLYQDVNDDLESHVDHGTSKQAAMHTVTFAQDFLGYSAGDKVTVASRHHQAVHKIAPDFQIIARSDDGGVEAIMGRGHVGVQWHAESDHTAPNIYGVFVAHCAQRLQPSKAPRGLIRSKTVAQLIAAISPKK